MNNLTKSIICVVVLAGAFAFGRYSSPEKIKTETKIVTVEVEKQHSNTNTHTETTQRTNPDGTTTTTTVTDSSTNTSTIDRSRTNSDTTKETIYAKNSVIIGPSMSFDILHPSNGFSPGAHLGVPVLGFLQLDLSGHINGQFNGSLNFKF